MGFERGPLQVNGAAHLGEQLFHVGAPTEVVSSEVMIIIELRLLRAEVVALRADLASRTLTARLRRCWLWVRVQVDNLTTSA